MNCRLANPCYRCVESTSLATVATIVQIMRRNRPYKFGHAKLILASDGRNVAKYCTTIKTQNATAVCGMCIRSIIAIVSPFTFQAKSVATYNIIKLNIYDGTSSSSGTGRSLRPETNRRS